MITLTVLQVTLIRIVKIRFTLFITFIIMLMPSLSLAEDNKRGELFCYPIKKIHKILNNIEALDAKYKNVIDINVNPKFIIKDGGSFPEQFFLRFDNKIIDVPVDKTNGATPTFLTETYKYPKSEACILDPLRSKRPKYDEGLYFEMGLSPFFINNSGYHDIAELEKGARDGKRFYREMILSPFKVFMPNTDHFAIHHKNFQDEGPPLFAKTSDGISEIKPLFYDGLFLVSLRELRNIKAKGLIVNSDSYDIKPIVSIKYLKRFNALRKAGKI